MTANEFMLGTDAGGIGGMTSLSTLLQRKGIPQDPDHSFADYTTDFVLGDGSRRGDGFPTCTWHWSHLNEYQLRALRTIVPGASAAVYIRVPINDTDLYGQLEWHTYEAMAWWPSGERGKVPGLQSLDFTLVFHSLIEVE